MAGGQQPQENDVPVYLFTGFLEAGKTKFIQETLEDKRFNSGEKTMLLRRARRNTIFPLCPVRRSISAPLRSRRN